MKPNFKNLSQKGLRISTALIFVLTACGKQNGDVLKPEHRLDSTQKTTGQKLRQQCYTNVADRTVNDKLGVKICTLLGSEDPNNPTYKKSDRPRKFKISKQTKKDNTVQEKIAITASVEFVKRTSDLSNDQEKLIVSMIEKQCLANMQYFWSKADVALSLNLQVEAEKAKVDQVLTLNFKSSKVVGAVETSNVKTSSGLEYDLQIDEWARGPKFHTSPTLECNKAAADTKGVTDGEREQIRNDCLKLSNQPFCLSLNKMIGHWLGAEDQSDINCSTKTPAMTTLATEKKPEIATPVAAPPVDPKEDKPTVDESSLISFMSFLVNPVAATLTEVKVEQIPVPEKAADAAATSEAGEAPVAKIAEEDVDHAVANLAALAALTDANIGSGADANLAVPPKPNVSPKVEVAPEPVADQSKDPSYQAWLAYTVTKEDMLSIFNCDLTKQAPPKPAAVQNQKMTNGKPAPAAQKPRT